MKNYFGEINYDWIVMEFEDVVLTIFQLMTLLFESVAITPGQS